MLQLKFLAHFYISASFGDITFGVAGQCVLWISMPVTIRNPSLSSTTFRDFLRHICLYDRGASDL